MEGADESFLFLFDQSATSSGYPRLSVQASGRRHFSFLLDQFEGASGRRLFAFSLDQLETASLPVSMPMTVNGEFLESGGFISFDNFNVYLTLPRNVTKSAKKVQISFVPPENAEVPLVDGECLVSNVFEIQSTGMFTFKLLNAPAMLEIRCNILGSTMKRFQFSHLSMIQYDSMKDVWEDVEKIENIPKRYYWYEENDTVPIVQAWISKFTRFAVVMRPKVHTVIVPDSGMTWSPLEDHRISLTFEPKTFDVPEECCSIKVLMPNEQTEFLVSPAISVKTHTTMKKSVKMTLPVTGITLPLLHHSGGAMKILRKENEADTEWTLVDPQPGDVLDFNTGIFHLTVPKFSILRAIWSTTANAVKRIFQPVYDTELHLYKGSRINERLQIKVACTPMTCSQIQRDIWVKQPTENGYLLVDSASSNWRLADLEKILVEAEGEYINGCQPGVEYFTFKRNWVSHKPVILRKTRISSEDGGKLRMSKEGGEELWNYEYLKNFALASAYDKRDVDVIEPIRFLGMQLERCGLRDISIYASDLRNQLHRTGMSEDFIDELKKDLERKANPAVIKKVFKRITKLFAAGKLRLCWFDVFENHLHPGHTRENLISVMSVLTKPFNNFWRIKELPLNHIICDPDFCKFLRPLCSNLGIEIADYTPASATWACQEVLDQWPALNARNCCLDIVKAVLLLKKDGFQDAVDRILDSFGSWIENQIVIIT